MVASTLSRPGYAVGLDEVTLLAALECSSYCCVMVLSIAFKPSASVLLQTRQGGVRCTNRIAHNLTAAKKMAGPMIFRCGSRCWLL
jgi:hypothetical protein